MRRTPKPLPPPAEEPDLLFRWRREAYAGRWWTETPAALYAQRRQVRRCPFCGAAITREEANHP